MTDGLAAGAPLVEASRLAWRAGGRRIVGPIDLSVAAGDRLALVGPNGAGKTTLARLLCGLLAPSAGELRWRGERYATIDRRRLARRVAYVPQVRPEWVPLAVEELVLLGRYPHLGRFQLAPTAADHRVVDRVLRTIGLEPLRGRPMGELSGGERQAAFIAAALAQEAELLVLDEPTTHLDPSHQRDVARLVDRLGRAGEHTVVLATHDLNLASLVATRVVALAGGRIAADGSPAEVLRPDRLAELFDAPFEVVRGGERPVLVVDLER